MSGFSFPILENEDLFMCLADMEVPLQAGQMTKPTYEVVRPMFEQIVIMLTGVTREDLTQPVFTAMDVFEFPELHDDSISANNFFRQLSKLLVASGVDDFSWKDVFKPDPVRLRRHLSAIINFAKFREEKLAMYQEMQERLEARGEEMRQMEESHAQNLAELKRLQSEAAQQQQQVSAVDVETNAQLLINQKLSKQAMALQEEVRHLKAQGNALADQASQAKLELSALQQDTEQLQDQVVQSPEKHRLANVELATATDAQRTYNAQLHSAAIENDKKLEMVFKLDKEVARSAKLLEELEAAVARKKDVSQNVKDVRGAVAAQSRALADLDGALSTAQRHHANLCDKLQRAAHQAELKLEAAESAVQQELKSREAVQAEIAAVEARAAEGEAAIRAIADKRVELEEGHAAQLKAITDRYGLLRKGMGDHHAKLSAAMAVDMVSQLQGLAGLRM